jgi:cytochrome c-type biogenesis protein CcmH/NrfG
MTARVSLAVVAVLCLVVLGFWARASVLETRAQRISDDPFQVTDAPRVARAERSLESATAGNPDKRPALVRGQLLIRAGRERDAIDVLEELTRSEPDSVEAWAQLAVAAREVDPARARAARARVLELNPLAAD